MAMSATAIRFAPEEKQWIQAYADLNGQSFSEFVRESALERVEDALDIQDYQEALKEDDGEHISMDEVLRLAASQA